MAGVDNPAAVVERIVTDWWKANEAPLLLSKLGSLLPIDVQRYLRVERVPLKRLIRDELEGRVRLLNMVQLGGGVVPVKETAQFSEEDLEQRFEVKRRERIEERVPRYNAIIWDAFRTALLPDRRRFVRVGPNGEVELTEIGSNAEPPSGDGWIEVAHEHLEHIPAGGPPQSREMDGAIKQWAKDRIDAALLLHPGKPKPRPSAAKDFETAMVPKSISAIVNGLQGFTREELARIHIPADVMLAVLQRSGRSQ